MKNFLNVFSMLLVSTTILYSNYNYSLIDNNSSSSTYEQSVGPQVFENQVTVHYFGHFN